MPNINPREARIVTIREERSGNRPPIQTLHTSVGSDFWNSLAPEVQAINAPRLRDIEIDLTRHFPAEFTSPLVSKTRKLSGLRQTEQQTDHESCSYVSLANGLRILDGAHPAYTRDALKDRFTTLTRDRLGPQARISHQVLDTDITQIFGSGAPYDIFTISGYKPMEEVLHDLAHGAVVVADWPHSAARTPRYGVTETHARTISGFSIQNGSIFFHVVDPYNPVEEPWSLRDLLVAHALKFRVSGLEGGIKDANGLASVMFVIKKTGSRIQTLES